MNLRETIGILERREGIAKRIIAALDKLLSAYRLTSGGRVDKALDELESIRKKYPKEYEILRGQK